MLGLRGKMALWGKYASRKDIYKLFFIDINFK
jgi:hypothetical protein